MHSTPLSKFLIALGILILVVLAAFSLSVVYDVFKRKRFRVVPLTHSILKRFPGRFFNPDEEARRKMLAYVQEVYSEAPEELLYLYSSEDYFFWNFFFSDQADHLWPVRRFSRREEQTDPDKIYLAIDHNGNEYFLLLREQKSGSPVYFFDHGKNEISVAGRSLAEFTSMRKDVEI